jgi:hypothetical protein
MMTLMMGSAALRHRNVGYVGVLFDGCDFFTGAKGVVSDSDFYET